MFWPVFQKLFYSFLPLKFLMLLGTGKQDSSLSFGALLLREACRLLVLLCAAKLYFLFFLPCSEDCH